MDEQDFPEGPSGRKPGGVDILKALEVLLGDTGTAVTEYGGFVITVTDHASFPWYEVFNLLVGKSFEVWMDRKNGNLIIVSKQKTD